MKKSDLYSEKSKNIYKCLNCGDELEEDEEPNDSRLSSFDDVVERWYCPKCGNNYKYHHGYSLYCIQAYDDDYEEQLGMIVFPNKEVESTIAEGILDKYSEDSEPSGLPASIVGVPKEMGTPSPSKSGPAVE
jgi:rubredoxin